MDAVPSFVDRTNFRAMPEGYAGDVLVWDIDKTYLDTRFSSLRGLLGIVVEAALDKTAIPGAVPLIRALRRGAGEHNALVPLYFVSGSPRQLRGILERKMLLDGVQFDGITFKDQLGYLKQGRPGAIKEQVGYKLCALLLYRRDLPGPSTWWLFGDDVEADASVMTLFGEACAGLRGDALRARMLSMGAAVPETEAAVRIADTLPVAANPVQRVFIRLDRSAGPQAFTQERVAPVRSHLQAALVLAHEGRIRRGDVSVVADDLRRALVPERILWEHGEDAVGRLGVPRALLDAIRP
jgi:hypothetical protein